MYKDFADLCEEKQVTPYRIAKECGFSNVTLSDWKNKGSTPRADKLIAIARYLNTTVEYLVTGENALPMPRLPQEDESLLENFHKLNAKGKDSVREHIKILLGNEEYIKDTPGTMMDVG